jgi:LysM repeat protein
MAQLSHFLTENDRIQVKNTLDSTHNSASPAVKPYFAAKLKKTLSRLALTGIAIFALSTPLMASADIFSFASQLLNRTANQTSAAGTNYNSQTMPLLAPAINIDPSPAVGGGDISVVAGSALLAQDGPSGTAADIHDHPANAQISVYIVHNGDTLSSIAKMFDVSVNTIVWANNIQRGVISPGQQLVILPITGVRYQVQKGDTIASVAKKYSADADEVAQYNDLTVGASLTVGSTIIVPDGEIAPAPIVKKTSTSVGSNPLRGAGGPNLAGYYGWPVDGGVITQGLHGFNGVDIGAPAGTNIFAAAAGTVIIANGSGGWNGGYGNYVVIQHANGTQTLYAHMSKVLATAGDQVVQGATIGLVGRTGKATGNHLHFEVRGAKNPFGY